MTYNAIPPTQKKLLEEQPMLRKKPERDIIPYTFVIRKRIVMLHLEKKLSYARMSFGHVVTR